tara:strand:- start:82 stop:1029 length:948 start_codon:yes stop_codon:yes gene_type:complete
MKSQLPSRKKNQNHKNCPACKSNKNNFFFRSIDKDYSFKNFNYLKCDKCKSIFLSSKSFNDKKSDYYHRQHWYKKNQFTFGPKTSTKRFIDGWYQTYKDFKLNKRLKVLDIGCGDGSFLISLKKMKFNKLYGFDTSSKTIKKIKDKKIITFVSNFSNFYSNEIISNLKFDYIFLHGVLEHSFNPSELLKNIKKITKKNSTIFIKIPSGDSLELEMLNEYNWTSMAPFHRTLFSKKGVSILLNKEGFNEIKFITTNEKIWGWTRGISWKLGLEKFYEKLRANKIFKKFDYEIDDMFEKISILIGKEPYIFLKCKIK